MTPQEKANEYLLEFSKEKAIEVAGTMKFYAQEFETAEWVYFWSRVIYILKSIK